MPSILLGPGDRLSWFQLRLFFDFLLSGSWDSPGHLKGFVRKFFYRRALEPVRMSEKNENMLPHASSLV